MIFQRITSVAQLLFLASTCYAHTLHVAVIDTGLDMKDVRFAKHLCPSGHRDFTGRGLKDVTGHGTHIVGLIIKYAKDADYCLQILKFYHDSKLMPGDESLVQALRYARRADIVNLSAGGGEANEEERAMIAALEGTLVCAAGNNGADLADDPYYPASYALPNMIPVGALDKDEHKQWVNSNYGLAVKAWEVGQSVKSTVPTGEGYMSGTSQATAIHTGKLVYSQNNMKPGI